MPQFGDYAPPPAQLLWHAGEAFLSTLPRIKQRPAGEETGAASKPRGRHAKVRRGKMTARKVSDVTSLARLTRAIGVLVDALGKWFD